MLARFAVTVLPFGIGICMTGPVSEEKYIRNLLYCSCSFGNNWTSRIFCGPNSIGTLPLLFSIVNPGSPFEQTMMSPSTRCYIPSFKVIGRGSGEEEGFLPYMGMVASLVM